MSQITPADICNDALLNMGQETIDDLNDGSNRADKCEILFNPVRKYMLRVHPWNFATKRDVLSPESSNPAGFFGYTFRHRKPSDSLRILKVGQRDHQAELRFKLEGKFILADTDTLHIRYIQNIEDMDLADPIFLQAFGFYLGWKLTYSLVEAKGKRDDMWDSYDKIVKRAKFTESAEDPQGFLEAETLIDARLNVGSRHSPVRNPGT